MKLKYIIPVLAAVAVVSCQKEDEGFDFNTDTNAVRVEATVGSLFTTRSTPLENGAASTVFKIGDKVAVSADDQKAVNYTFNGTKWSAEAGKYLRWDTETMTFTAWYPSTASMTNFTLPTDQSTTALIESGDYMTYSGDHTKNGIEAISLTLKRKTARVIVKITGFGDEYIYMGRQQKVSDVKIGSGAAGYAAGVVSGSASRAMAYTTSDGTINSVYTALVIPTVANSAESFITLIDGGGYTLLTKGIPAMEAGKSYTYNLTVGKDDVAITKITVNDWATGEVITGESEMAKPWDGTVATGFAKGSGTMDNPYQISNGAELAYLASEQGIAEQYGNKRFYCLTSDINLNYIAWKPIGTSLSDATKQFRASFDGNGHTIAGLKLVNAESQDVLGLFGVVIQNFAGGATPFACIKNLNIVGAQVEASSTVTGHMQNSAILVGYASGSTNSAGVDYLPIENCHVSGTLLAKNNVCERIAGMVGTGSLAYFKNCSANVKIEGNARRAGGFAGILFGCKVSNSTAKGSVNGAWILGGFTGGAERIDGSAVGFPITETEIDNCKTSVNITTSDWNVGGFVGWSNAIIDNCTASGDVTSTAKFDSHYYKTGGFAGTNGGIIRHSVFSGTLKGGDTAEDAWKYYGGFIGSSNAGRTVKCRFDGTKNSDYSTSGLSWMNEGATSGNDISDIL